MSGIEATSPVQRVPTSGAKAGSKEKTSRDRRQELLIQRKSKGRGEERPVGEGEVIANDGIHIAELEHEASFWIK